MTSGLNAGRHSRPVLKLIHALFCQTCTERHAEKEKGAAPNAQIRARGAAARYKSQPAKPNNRQPAHGCPPRPRRRLATLLFKGGVEHGPGAFSRTPCLPWALDPLARGPLPEQKKAGARLQTLRERPVPLQASSSSPELACDWPESGSFPPPAPAPSS